MAESLEREVPILNSTIQELMYDSLYSSKKMFIDNISQRVPDFLDSSKIKLLTKIKSEYRNANKKSLQNPEAEIKKESASEENIDVELENITLKVNEAYNKNLPQHQNTASSKLKSLERSSVSTQATNANEKTNVSEISKIIDELPKEQQEKLSKIPKKFLIFNKPAEDKRPNFSGVQMITDGSSNFFFINVKDL